MSFTINDVKPFVAEAAHKNASSSAGSTTDVSLRRWIMRAIRHMQHYDFECWRQTFSLTLTAGTYQYLYSDAVWTAAALVRPLRLDGNSLRYGSTDLLFRPSISRLDEEMGSPAWKDASDAGGTPSLWTEMGGGIVIAAKPDATFTTANPTLSGYYYRGEDLSTSGFEDAALAMYDDFLPHLVDLSLIFALQQVDDTSFATLLQQWEQIQLPMMRGYDHVISDDEPIPGPSWAPYVDGHEDEF